MGQEPDEGQILEQVEKIVSSEGFASSPRKRKFLRYIVEKTLDGEAASLKGYTIGVDVFERGEQFDPQLDTIVRVQARNLRRTLRLYNLSEGKDDQVVIGLPKGGYVPTFALREPKALEADIPKVEPRKVIEVPAVATEFKDGIEANPGRLKPVFAIGVVIVALGILSWLLLSVVNDGKNRQRVFEEATLLPNGPSISISPFDIIENNTNENLQIDTENLGEGLQVELVDKISRFRDLFVVDAVRNPNRHNATGSTSATQFDLRGSIQRSGDNVRVTSILSRNSNGEILWSRSHSETLDSPASLLKIQSDIAVDVAASLGQPYSRINSRFLIEQSSLADMDFDHYLCLMKFYKYLKEKTEPEHERVRGCLEKATKGMPSFSSGWAALSWMYADEAFNNFNVRATTIPPKQRALIAAEEAVKADPDNAMAYQYLAIAKFALNDDSGFLEAAETALRLNPNDAEVLADIGSHLIQMDNSEDGQKMVEKAIAMNPAHPAWYHGSIFMYYYTRNESEIALHHAREYLKDGSVAAHMHYTAVLAQIGQIEAAQTAFQTLTKTYPHFQRDFRNIITETRIPDGMAEQLISDLTTAGLTPAL